MRQLVNTQNDLLLDTGEIYKPVWKQKMDGSYVCDPPKLSNGKTDYDLLNYSILNNNDNEKHATYIKNTKRAEALDWQHKIKNIGRNDKCPCNSGKKYKKCCLKL